MRPIRWMRGISFLVLLFAHSAVAATPKFDESAVAWHLDRQLYIAGIERAEAFRRRLVAVNADGTSEADLLALALQQFREKSTAALEGRADLRRFDIDRDSFLRQLRALDQLDPAKCFESFTGRWYGVWDRMHVDHHWHAVAKSPFSVDASLPRVSVQYAWIGDGFGWNYLAAPVGERSDGNVVLGMVYHVQPHQPDQIRLRRPHVGYYADPGKLIWLTAQEVFCEEILWGRDEFPERYAITGFCYRIRGGTLTSIGKAFQAVYTRQADQRQPFFEFPISVSVASSDSQR